MMLRAQSSGRGGVSLLLNIHDELVFECPVERTLQFIRAMERLLELPPDS